MYRLGWFSTGRDRAARDLLTAVWDRIRQGKIEADISFVFSNRQPGQARESDLFFDLVRDYRIPLVCFPSKTFRPELRSQALPQWRLEYDREVMKRLQGFQPDLCVLAGYMLIVGREMCQRYKMVNLHPAAPGGPSGTWQEVMWQLIEDGAHSTGVMMHLVTPDLDKGPPVTYCTFPIRGKPFDRHWDEIRGLPVDEVKRRQGEDNTLFKLIRKHELARELPLITTTIKAFTEGRVRIEQGRVVDASGRPINGYDLTTEVDEMARATIG
ncbi:MAG: phosphoglycerate transporter [Chloroflexi bacterium]|nr:MAG: phosphoglycerate transporter [Chloroflexota bacterium]